MRIKNVLLKNQTDLKQCQKKYLKKILKNRDVIDLGSGDPSPGSITHWISQHAKSVFAIDYKVFAIPANPKIQLVTCDLKNGLPSKISTKEHILLCSWPANRFDPSAPDWASIIPAFQEIIYLGKNSDGICCGNPILFKYLLKREPFGIFHEKEQTLIHYGPNRRKAGTPMTQEEYLGFKNWVTGHPPQPFQPEIWYRPKPELTKREPESDQQKFRLNQSEEQDAASPCHPATSNEPPAPIPD